MKLFNLKSLIGVADAKEKILESQVKLITQLAEKVGDEELVASP